MDREELWDYIQKNEPEMASYLIIMHEVFDSRMIRFAVDGETVYEQAKSNRE